jgi:hypothetical protein
VCCIPLLQLINGILYSDRNHHLDDKYLAYRTAFLEMLMLARWLYASFPGGLLRDCALAVLYASVHAGYTPSSHPCCQCMR